MDARQEISRHEASNGRADEPERPEDTIPDLPENQRAREFLRSAPSKGLWMPLGQSVKVMQCFRCKANGHANGGYGHRTGDRECPYFLSGNAANEEMRRRQEDPMTGQLSTDRAGKTKPQLGSVDEVRSLLAQIKEVEKLKKKRKRRKDKKKKRKRHKSKHKSKHKRHRKESDSSSSDSDSSSENKHGRGQQPYASAAATTTLATGSDSDIDASISDNPVVVFDTSKGVLSVEIFLDKVPLTASSFLDLVDRGFYNGLHFHRVIEGFALQIGCPYSRDPRSQKTGTGAPEPRSSFTVRGGARKGETLERDDDGMIQDEHVWRKQNSLGTLSMANTGEPHSGGSQFIINLAANSFLDWFDEETTSKHVVFGRVLLGLEVVKEIGSATTGDDDRPTQPIQVRSASCRPIPCR